MVKKNQQSKTPQPALVPLHAAQGKKTFSLDRDAVVVGRARGCDIGLDAPDVSNLHCVIARTADGYRIRDCSSRAGTKINGDSVKNAALHDGDVLQVGPFCFTVQIPQNAPASSQALDVRRAEHWQNSRRHLAQQALRLRKKLLTLLEEGVCQTPSELSRKIADLKERLRLYDHRSTELEEAERELADEQSKLRREKESHLAHVQKVQTEMGEHLKEVDEQIRQKWQEFQQRCRREEERLAEAVRGLPRPEARRLQDEADRETLINQVRQISQERDKALAELKAQKEQAERQAQRLSADRDRAAAELRENRARLQQEHEKLLREQHAIRAQMELEEDAHARRLDKTEDEIHKEKAQLASARRQLEEDSLTLEKQRQELTTMQAQLNGHQFPSATDDDTENLKAGLANVENSLDEQRQSLALIMGDLEKIQQSLLDRQESVLRTFEEENGHLRARVRELEKRFSAPAANDVRASSVSDGPQQEVAALEEENAHLLRRVQELENLLTSPAPDARPIDSSASDDGVSESMLLQLRSDAEAAALAESQAELDKLRSDLNKLRTELTGLNRAVAERDRQIDALKKEAAPIPSGTLREADLEAYEAELNQERKRIEAERSKLNAEIEQLRTRNGELDEAVREMEMEMSRERADLARERTRLDRLREETRLEMERLQRDGPVRDSLISVQKLRDEMNKNKSASVHDRPKSVR